MKSNWTTPEFWAALIGQVVGLVVLFGGITAGQGDEMAAALKSISGGVLSVLTILGYIKAQSVRKALAVRLQILAVNVRQTSELDPVKNSSVDNKTLDDIGNLIGQL